MAGVATALQPVSRLQIEFRVGQSPAAMASTRNRFVDEERPLRRGKAVLGTIRRREILDPRYSLRQRENTNAGHTRKRIGPAECR